MSDSFKSLAEALIIAMKNEIRVIELYTHCLKRDLSEQSRESIKAVTRDEERHMKMLSEVFEKKIGKKIDGAKLKDHSLKAIKNLTLEPYSIHIIDVAMGYEHREKDHFIKAQKVYGSDADINALFVQLIADEEAHINVLEKERKAVLGLPFEEFELDFYVRE
ncbi:MAG: hypothetical protein HZA77_13425 [Candidatus Schekmanbacteria bacterium]|nr:hypothetical protein [Candidatus Schekmanbacteria bacterium]